VRISVVGTSGSGKTTLAKALARQTGLPYIELDALNWQAGWGDLSRGDPTNSFDGLPPRLRAMRGWSTEITALFATSSGDGRRIWFGSIISGPSSCIG
jgi:gluconate kinase